MLLPLTLLSAATIVVSQQSSYAPTVVSCPGSNFTSILRNSTTNQTLNPDEIAYITERETITAIAFQTYLANRTSQVYAGNNVSSLNPKIGLALSGGGMRAALYAAGVLAAFDGRNTTVKSNGLGGILQSTSYASGVSGGSWALSSLILNDLPPIYEMVLGNATSPGGWNLALDLFNPSQNATEQKGWVNGILRDLSDKFNNGFNVTMNDYWSRALSYHFFPGTTSTNFFDNTTDQHGAGVTFSSATNLSSWRDHSLPFPLIVIDSYSPTPPEVTLTHTVYEASPLEFGSFDAQLQSFIPTPLLGSSAIGTDRCVHGYDTSFVMGTSSNLFDGYNTSASIAWTIAISPVFEMKEAVNSTFFAEQPSQQIDIAAVPNPFYGIAGYEDANQTRLRLLDGGSDGENLGSALFIRSRGLDVVIALDASNNGLGRPDGSALYATRDRMAGESSAFADFPPIPTNQSTFIASGYATRPTFFGCNRNATSQYPMIIYLPNFDTTNVTNTSTTQTQYSDAESLLFLDTVYNFTIKADNANWSTCFACALVESARQRHVIDVNGTMTMTTTNRTATCETCLDQYCYNELLTNGTAATGTSTPLKKSAATATGVSYMTVGCTLLILVFGLLI